MKKRRINSILGITILGILVSGISACSSNKEVTISYLSYKDLDGCNFAITDGNSSYMKTIESKLPNVKWQTYTGYQDTFVQVANGRADAAFAFATTFLPIDMSFKGELTYIELPYTTAIASAFSKSASATLKQDFNDYIEECISNGKMDALCTKWFKNYEKNKDTFDFKSLPVGKGKFSVGISDNNIPYSFSADGKNYGFENELIYNFCKDTGYGVEFSAIPYDSMLAGLETNKYDMCFGGFGITPEKAESVEFSKPFFYDNYIAVVRKDRVPGTSPKFKSFSELEGKTIGILDGCAYVQLAQSTFSKSTLKFYKNSVDYYNALDANKVDAIIDEELAFKTYKLEKNPYAAPINEFFAENPYNLVFPKNSKGEKLQFEFNTYIAKIKNSGELKQIQNKWFVERDDFSIDRSFVNEAGREELVLATCPMFKPLTFLSGKDVSGLETDLLYRFMKEYNYKPKTIKQEDFLAVLSDIEMGKIDIGYSSFNYTEERAKSMLFSDSYYNYNVYLITKSDDYVASKANFFDSFKESIYKTFVKENRWKLITSGLGVTVLITLAAVLIGTLCGFGLYLLDYQFKGVGKFLNGLSFLVNGMPVLVILLIFYYVIFAATRISGEIVSIVVFSLLFMLQVYDILSNSVKNVGKDQFEAATALGFTRNKTLYKVILPQALPSAMPQYKGGIIALLKSTAIVGYVAVSDLTKAGDLIRSLTFEAFFPLLSIAIIYFGIICLSIFLLNRIKINPKSRKKNQILKGVDKHD